MYNCKILLDSISETGKRITTMEITFPRIVLAEFNTHRMFSRNSASSRAIPFKKQLERVINNPFIPERFPVDGKGMQPNSYVDANNSNYGWHKEDWLRARDSAIKSANRLYGNDIENEYHVHKQIVNRLLEPFQWHTVIVTSTEWDNFFKLRCDENAQYEIRRIADLMYEAYHAQDNHRDKNIQYVRAISDDNLKGEVLSPSIKKLKVGEWHCPLISNDVIYKDDNILIIEYTNKNIAELRKQGHNLTGFYADDIYNPLIIEIKKKISVARCARVSYLRQDEKNIEKDLELFNRLTTAGHWSPTEHIATPLNDPNQKSGNFYGWLQYRKTFKNENTTNFRKYL